jgi:hypothetical protein
MRVTVFLDAQPHATPWNQCGTVSAKLRYHGPAKFAIGHGPVSLVPDESSATPTTIQGLAIKHGFECCALIFG